MPPASRPADTRNPSHANTRHIGPPREPLHIQFDVQTDRHTDQPISPDHESSEAKQAESLAPISNAAKIVTPAASSAPPLSTPVGPLAPAQAFKGGSQVHQSASPSVGEASSGPGELAASSVDYEDAPESAIGIAEAKEKLLSCAANVGERETLAAAGTSDAKSQCSPAETVLEHAEASVTTTETAEAKTVSLSTESLASAENDATHAADEIDGRPCDSGSDPIGPEISAGENMLPVADEAQPEASVSITGPKSKYRPRLGPRPAPSPRPAATQTGREQTSGSLEAILLLTVLPGEWGISLAVLLGRADGMPENVEVRVDGTTYSLLTIDARLFEPFEPPGDIDLIGDGFAAEGTTPPIRRWVRTKRDLHVFSERAGVSGFASVPRALIGQENVVLCRAHLAATAIDCARATGSAELQQIAGPGIPDGWQCFRAFRPKAPAEFGEASDIFLSLNPLPDAAIELSGGIASGRSTWIVGAPPTIRILGTDPSAAEFTIDGHPAIPGHSDGWLAPGWDAVGTHTIRFGGLSRTYEIAEIDETWPIWATDSASAYFACGAKVSAPAQSEAFAFAGGPRWLLGACAGDFAFAAQSPSGIAIAAPPFRPVWAVTARMGGRLVPAAALPFRAPPQMPSAHVARQQIAQWCNLLRGSSAPTESSSKDLWRQYRQLARRLRRRDR